MLGPRIRMRKNESIPTPGCKVRSRKARVKHGKVKERNRVGNGKWLTFVSSLRMPPPYEAHTPRPISIIIEAVKYKAALCLINDYLYYS